MCGIAGVFGLEIDNKSSIIKKMTDSISHRGPDAEGVFCNEIVALGHRRLSIIDLSPQGNQPMYSNDGRYCIVYNGELYNYREIRKKLDYNFKTNTDTEVILASYIANGIKCLDNFNGMFAFAIWDNLSQELFIARDRLGIKPLYYFNDGNKILFASELRAILNSELIQRKLDKESLFDYMQYQTVHAPNTIIDGVKMLMPGNYLSVTKDKIVTENYWNLNSKKSVNTNSREEIKKDIHSLLGEAVEYRLVADVPFGAFLSGGIDSSIIVGLMSEVSTAKVNTFSITFNEEEFSEEKYSNLIAKKFNTEHHNIKLSPQHFLEELPDALNVMDHPSGDGPNTYVVSKATKKAGITMALSGLGGDELFCGYDIFKRTKSLTENKIANITPKFIRSFAGSTLSKIKNDVAAQKIDEILSLSKLSIENFYPINRKVILDNEMQKLFNNYSGYTNKVNEILKKSNFDNSKVFSNVSIAEISTYMQNVLLRDSDQMSMASALEVRVPFLDHRLVEYILSLPDDIKYPNYPKQLLVESVGDLLPKEIVYRPKMGFTFPWEHWLKNDLQHFCNDKLQSFKNRQGVNENYIDELWRKFNNGDATVKWSKIWGIVVLENWLISNNIE